METVKMSYSIYLFFIDLLYFFLNVVDIFHEKQDNLILTASDK